MSETETATDDVVLAPLLRRDPPRVGDIVLVGRLGRHDAGLTYAGRRTDPATSPSSEPDEEPDAEDPTSDAGHQVAVVMLAAGAETDSYARARFRSAIAALEAERAGSLVAAENEEDLAPWAAFTVPSWSEAAAIGDGLFKAVTLEDQPPVGVVQGPDFRPHWWERIGVGRWRLWPLPWPSSLSSAARWTFLASFAVICAIAALALWIAVLVFQHQPPPAPTPGPGPGPNPPSTPTPTPPSTPTPSRPSTITPGTTGPTIPPIV